MVGRDGTRYIGEVAANHPHGLGRLYVPRSKASSLYTLFYEGQWIQVCMR